ncbi:hypothetical protein [Natronolimnobius baerhuensis]|uniref:Glutamate--cysteine ligase n=1 Tax=Natronolimnobius baerhuensis TaxID=253108 RepID=A0A202E562_9EURY|nr:hypothetical protein [Natronolimnobius baerhuensis]OVE83402.1 hypothetical protein B2G88_13160 [Natronolimnobius baerhuensis]
MEIRLEVDYWVVDRDGELVSADPVVDVAGRASMSRGSADSLLTIETPFAPADDRRRALIDELVAACETATALDCRLVPLATPINGGSPYRCRRDSSDDSLPASAGARLQIHADAVLEQWNALLALTPALALVSSAPYVQGTRVANSARAHSYRTQHGIPTGERALEYVESIGALPSSDTPDEWPIALHRTCDSNGSSDSTTLEWLLPDTSLPSQLLRLTADVECVLEQVARGHVRVGRYATPRRSATAGDTDDITIGHVTNAEIALPRAEIVAQLTETAIDIGLDATGVADYLERMGFAVDSYHPIASRIDGRQFVTQADAQELRLEYAGRLEEDVRNLSQGGTQ